jgi:hypothetical protein
MGLDLCVGVFGIFKGKMYKGKMYKGKMYKGKMYKGKMYKAILARCQLFPNIGLNSPKELAYL